MQDSARREALKDMMRIPGIGKSLAGALWTLGYRCVADLKGQDPEQMYVRLCALSAGIDEPCRCVLYTFRCAVYFATEEKPDPKLLKWWAWKDKST
ncbi:MAG: helix-hairpin-helix domain-containing protein [Gemmatimonadota bacterium]|nr:helix-hairpin-helix domain-containing protein [Gemmatimonadota bacterium]